jgi:hypothetical protein
MAKADLTAQYLRDALHYDSKTGVFMRARDVMGGTGRRQVVARAGEPVGFLMKNGYLGVCIGRNDYYQHRLAWLHSYGQWPRGVIDHINGDRTDNRLENLRDVTSAMNTQNAKRARADSRIGLIGVVASGKRWSAHIRASGKRHYLGVFDAPEDAHAAYIAAKRRLHPGNTL